MFLRFSYLILSRQTKGIFCVLVTLKSTALIATRCTVEDFSDTEVTIQCANISEHKISFLKFNSCNFRLHVIH